MFKLNAACIFLLLIRSEELEYDERTGCFSNYTYLYLKEEVQAMLYRKRKYRTTLSRMLKMMLPKIMGLE